MEDSHSQACSLFFIYRWHWHLLAVLVTCLVHKGHSLICPREALVYIMSQKSKVQFNIDRRTFCTKLQSRDDPPLGCGGNDLIQRDPHRHGGDRSTARRRQPGWRGPNWRRMPRPRSAAVVAASAPLEADRTKKKPAHAQCMFIRLFPKKAEMMTLAVTAGWHQNLTGQNCLTLNSLTFAEKIFF